MKNHKTDKTLQKVWQNNPTAENFWQRKDRYVRLYAEFEN